MLLYRLMAMYPKRALRYMGRAYIGCCLAELGHYEDAVRVCESTLPRLSKCNLFTAEAFVREVLGRTYLHLGRFDDAARALRSAVVQSGAWKDVEMKARLSLAATLLSQSRFHETLPVCDILLGMSSYNAALIPYVRCYHAAALVGLGLFEKASLELDEVERMEISASERPWIEFSLWSNRANIHYMTENWQSALTAAEKVLAAAWFPEGKAHGLLFRARAMVGLGRIDEAEVECQTVSSISTLSTPTQAHVHMIGGTIAQCRSRLEKSAELYKQAASLLPQHPEPRYRLGRLLAQTQPDEARRWFTDAVEVNPQSYYGQLAKQELERLNDGRS